MPTVSRFGWVVFGALGGSVNPSSKNKDSYTLLSGFMQDFWRVLEPLETQDSENDDSFTFLMGFTRGSWGLWQSKELKMTTAPRFLWFQH